jgi:putative ATP-binding cassette transporter
MNMLDFFAREGDESRRWIIVLIVSSGLSGGLLLGVINAAAEKAANSEVQLYFFLLFAVTLVFFTVTKRTALVRATIAGEKVIRQTRIRVSDKIRHSELLFVEHTGRGDIYARLTQDTASISQAVPMIFNGYQSAVILMAGLIYIATVSWIACLLTFVFLSVGGYAYVRHSRMIIEDLKEATAKEAEFFDSLSHLVDGFKEIKINHAKNDGVQERVADVAHQTEGLMVRTGLRYITHLVTSQTMLYLLIATIVFALPTLGIGNPENILKLTASGLFIVAPLEVVFTAYYFHNKAAVALKNLQALEERLDRVLETSEAHYKPQAPQNQLWKGFETVSLKNLHFQYPGTDNPYSIGPIDLEIPRGSATFIIGGNGSGKSTLLKVLTGLYPPSSGYLLVDGKALSTHDYPSYRELYSAIFGDFHLFDRLYGLQEVDVLEVEALLHEMEIADKTRFVDNAFTRLDLSTGQRKRLAMIIARLDNKEIYVFDEWAADQDPQFRRNFYEVLLPKLKAKDKTIVVVSHDDAYFHHADQLIKLDYGRIVASSA